MKKVKKIILLATIMFLSGTIMQAQVKIGENSTPAKGALLDLNGTYKGGLLLPNVAITDLEVIPAGFTERGGADTAADLAGMIVWSTDAVNSGLYMWDGGVWQSLMCQEMVFPCSGLAPAPTAVDIPTGPFATGEIFPVSCTATEEGTTFYIWTVPAGLSITSGQGTKTINVSGTASTYNKNGFTVFAVNQCGQSATVNGGTGQIVVTAVLSTTPPPSSSIEISSGGNTELDGGTVSGGNCESYSYQWQVFNSPDWVNIPSATNALYQTPALSVNTQYRRIATCGTEKVTSGVITVTIKQVAEPGSVTATNTTICSGTSTTLNYTGGTGVTFEWYSGSCGGAPVGTGNSLQVSPTLTTTYYGRWKSGDSYSECKSVVVNVTQPVTPSVTISGGTTVTTGTNITFTATPTNGGTSPSYQWKVNGTNDGTNSATFTRKWASAGTKVITCEMTSGVSCVSSSTAISNQITVIVSADLATSTPCEVNDMMNLHPVAKDYPYRELGPKFCAAYKTNLWDYVLNPVIEWDWIDGNWVLRGAREVYGAQDDIGPNCSIPHGTTYKYWMK
jgi:hypothetical protein